jgi:hypothetical protein
MTLYIDMLWLLLLLSKLFVVVVVVLRILGYPAVARKSICGF